MTPRILLLSTLAFVLAGCGEEEPPKLPPRPVMSTIVAPDAGQGARFAGTVEARYETALGFTILGRLSERPVQVGDRIEKGQLVASIDTTVLESSVRQAAADLANAQAQLENAEASQTRQSALLANRVSSQASVDTAQQATVVARANVTQAQANLRKAREQLDEALLYADFPGVVTATGAEAGEVVSPGQSVVTVARTDVREVVLDLREEVAAKLQIGVEFEAALQLDASVTVSGAVREIAPEADPVTRSSRVRILLTDPPESFRLGTTVTASLRSAPKDRLLIPDSAVLQQDGRQHVWLVEGDGTDDQHLVSLQEIRARKSGDVAYEVMSGLNPGQRIVTAGVHSLQPGQKVRLYWGMQP